MSRITRIAHRGFSSEFPENTRAAFDAAVKNNADGIELDIQSSSDGSVFVFHDNDFTRMGIPSKPNSETNYSEISHRDIGSWYNAGFASQRVLALEELFKEYTPITRLLIEIKTWQDPAENFQYYREILEKLTDLTKKSDAWKKIELLCYAPEVLIYAKSLDDRFTAVLNTDDVLSFERLKKLKEKKIDVISVYIKNLDHLFSKDIKTLKFPLYTFTCNTEAELEKAITFDVDAIMSNHIVWLNNALSKRKR